MSTNSTNRTLSVHQGQRAGQRGNGALDIRYSLAKFGTRLQLRIFVIHGVRPGYLEVFTTEAEQMRPKRCLALT